MIKEPEFFSPAAGKGAATRPDGAADAGPLRGQTGVQMVPDGWHGAKQWLIDTLIAWGFFEIFDRRPFHQFT